MHQGTDHDHLYYAPEQGWPVYGPYSLDEIQPQLRARQRCGWPEHMVWRALAPNIMVAAEIIGREARLHRAGIERAEPVLT